MTTLPPRMHAFFGREVRCARDDAGLTAAELAEKTFYSRSQITMIETGHRLGVQQEPIERIDDALEQRGRLLRLWKEARKAHAPAIISELIEYEARATAIRDYQLVLVPGLLQTEGYMRVLFRAELLARSDADEVEEKVARRLARQEAIFAAANRVRYTAILDENAIARTIGDDSVMRDQLVHLCAMMERPGTTIQIMPRLAGTYPAAGPMKILDVDGAPVLHQEVAVGPGITVTEARAIDDAIERFDALRSQALRVAESIQFIEQRIEELEP